MTDRDLKDKQVKRAIEAFEKNGHTTASTEKKRELERMIVRDVMPQLDRK